MTTIYANSEEKYLKSVLLYAILKSGDEQFWAYYDSEGNDPVHDDVLWEDMFVKGLVTFHLIDASIREIPVDLGFAKAIRIHVNHAGNHVFTIPVTLIGNSVVFVGLFPAEESEDPQDDDPIIGPIH